MHVETYPVFLTPRDKKLSLSSSKEKSSKFGWQENKNENEGKTEQGSVYSIYLSIYFYITYLLHDSILHSITLDAREFI